LKISQFRWYELPQFGGPIILKVDQIGSHIDRLNDERMIAFNSEINSEPAPVNCRKILPFNELKSAKCPMVYRLRRFRGHMSFLHSVGRTVTITHVAAKNYNSNSRPMGDLGASLGSAMFLE
jgi:hypothetical protein